MENIFEDVIRPHLIKIGASANKVEAQRKKFETIAYDHGFMFELQSLMRDAFEAGYNEKQGNS